MAQWNKTYQTLDIDVIFVKSDQTIAGLALHMNKKNIEKDQPYS